MPSEPDSGPTMMSTLSCSTSFRVAFTATSGLAAEEALMISIFLPATMPWPCFTPSAAPRMPSWPPAAKGPSRVASRPILTTCWASAVAATATTIVATASIRKHCLVSNVIVSSFVVNAASWLRGWNCPSYLDPASQAPLGGPCAQTGDPARPPAENPVGGEQHDDQEHSADEQFEAL